MKLLSVAYLPPIEWFACLAAGDTEIEVCDHYIKQTYRNRCHIATPNGRQALVVPVSGTPACMGISEQASWRHTHWQALVSAYRMTPFFEYYADDLRPYYDAPRTETLYEYDLSLVRTLCRLLHLDVELRLTTRYRTPDECRAEGVTDLRTAIHPKAFTLSAPNQQRQAVLGDIQLQTTLGDIQVQTTLRDIMSRSAQPYYQVFASKTGFIPNLSVVDLLFNLGPEALLRLLPTA